MVRELACEPAMLQIGVQGEVLLYGAATLMLKEVYTPVTSRTLLRN